MKSLTATDPPWKAFPWRVAFLDNASIKRKGLYQNRIRQGPYVPTGKGAETFDDVAARLRAFLDEVIRPLEGKADKVLCVAHSFVLKTLVREYAGDSASDAAKKPLQRNCCVHVLECRNGRFTLKDTGRLYYNVADFDTMPEPIMVAHRGAGDRNSLRPESSAIAYSNAVETACDVVKLDLQFTKDKVVIMHHCPNLKRVMGWDADIKDYTYSQSANAQFQHTAIRCSQ